MLTGIGAGLAGAAGATAAAVGLSGSHKAPEVQVDLPSTDVKGPAVDPSFQGVSGDINAPKKKGFLGGLFGRKKVDADMPSAGEIAFHSVQ
jgi:hypothetical protein